MTEESIRTDIHDAVVLRPLNRVRSTCTPPEEWDPHLAVQWQRDYWRLRLGASFTSADELIDGVMKHPPPRPRALKRRRPFDGWEGPFVFPTIRTLLAGTTRHRGWSDYDRAREFVLDLVRESLGKRRFLNALGDEIHPGEEIPLDPWWGRLRRFEEQLPTSALTLWGLTGLAYRGQSSTFASTRVLRHGEGIGMTSLHGLLLVASRPDRIAPECLGIDCIGSRRPYEPLNGEPRCAVPSIEAFDGEKIRLADFWEHGAASGLGAGTLYLPPGF